MASTESMDDSFRARVDKIFGSLARSTSSGWSLSDEAVEKREWRREDKRGSSARDETPYSSSFEGFFSRKDRRQQHRREPDDDDVENDGGGNRDMDREEWEIRSSIGLDNTLDNEEEEDEFDKVAAGRENAGERLYMNDVTERGSFLSLHNVIPNSFKDPRANHYAARIRLKEDAVEARQFDVPCPETDTQGNKSLAKVLEKGFAPKPILKRRDNSSDSNKPRKRVRFDPDCIIDSDQASETFKGQSETSLMNATDSDDGSKLMDKMSRVPDYIIKPSKCMHYSFDSSSEVNEGSDTEACMDVLELIKRSKVKELGQELDNASGDLPKSVTFIPRKKGSRQSEEDDRKQSLPQAGLPVGIAAGVSQDSEVTAAYEVIEPEISATDDSARSYKPLRKYRTQSRSDDSDP